VPATTVTIERVVAGGAGLGHLDDGKVVFVDGALPGETVEATIVDDRRDFAQAQITQVLVAAPARIEPPCPALAAGCGGCSWQHVEPAAQLDLKVGIVRDALRRTAGLPDVPVHAAGTVPAFGYRTSLRLAVGVDGRLGLRRAASHDVVALDACLVAHPTLSALIGDLRTTGRGEVALRVSAATGERTALALAPTTRDRRNTRRPARAAAKPQLTGFPAGTGLGPRATVHERVAGVDLRVSAASFFQSGPAAAELLVAEVGAAVGVQDGPLLDAYGGVGLFAATVASVDHEVVVVESSPSACADARSNLAGIGGRVVETTFERWQPEPFDVVVADPARSGLGAQGATNIAATDARRIVLVSCDPVSLARDARMLADRGYVLRSCAVLDLFPHTAHVEVVSTFDRADLAPGDPDG
jgi:23S rRNA (uracil1939-C5)-methyltransferase